MIGMRARGAWFDDPDLLCFNRSVMLSRNFSIKQDIVAVAWVGICMERNCSKCEGMYVNKNIFVYLDRD
jgi:hypothetical protein